MHNAEHLGFDFETVSAPVGQTRIETLQDRGYARRYEDDISTPEN
jgi:hypothetical protein